MNIPLMPGDVWDNTTLKGKFFPGPVRFLGRQGKFVWFISLPQQHHKKKNQMKQYSKGPFKERFDEFLAQIQAPAIHKLNYSNEARVQQTDGQARKIAETEEEIKRLDRDFHERDRRLKIIYPIIMKEPTIQDLLSPIVINERIEDAPNQVLDNTPALATAWRTALEVIADKVTPSRIRVRAKALGVAPSTIYAYLHLFWAKGSRRNALLPMYTRCGNKGLEKLQLKKLGRNSILARDGHPHGRGYSLTKEDKQKLSNGFKLVATGISVEEAFNITSSCYWANHKTNRSGQIIANLFAPHLRPTLTQFMYWGKRGNDNQSTGQLRMSPKKQMSTSEVRFGSLDQLASTVGQYGTLDTTSTDTYLTSVSSRLIPLQPPNRMLLLEHRLGLILAIYLGWEPLTPRLGTRVILLGASSKKALFAKHGMEVTDHQCPAILCRTYLVDNGELKSDEATQGEVQFGYGLEFARAGVGPDKGRVEAQNAADHKIVDHQLPGTTMGKTRSRGEPHPALSSLFNINELERDYLKHWIYHNSVEEVPHLRPTEMLKQEPHIAPTRSNIFAWYQKNGMVTSLGFEDRDLQPYFLDSQPAVIMKNGLYLKAEIHGRLTKLDRPRFSSTDSNFVEILDLLQHSDIAPIHTEVTMDKSQLAQVYLLTKKGWVQLECQNADTTLSQHTSLSELVAMMADQALRSKLRSGEVEQARAESTIDRFNTRTAAAKQKKAEIALLGKAPSKSKSIRGMKSNTQLERDLLPNSNLANRSTSGEAEVSTNLGLKTPPSALASLTPAEVAMQRLLETGD